MTKRRKVFFPTDLPILVLNDLEHILEESIVPNQPADDEGIFNMFLYITFSFSVNNIPGGWICRWHKKHVFMLFW